MNYSELLAPSIQIRQSLVAEFTVLQKRQQKDGESGPHLPSQLPAAKIFEFSWTNIRLFLRELLCQLDFPLVILEPATDTGHSAYFAEIEAAYRSDITEAS